MVGRGWQHCVPILSPTMGTGQVSSWGLWGSQGGHGCFGSLWQVMRKKQPVSVGAHLWPLTVGHHSQHLTGTQRTAQCHPSSTRELGQDQPPSWGNHHRFLRSAITSFCETPALAQH